MGGYTAEEHVSSRTAKERWLLHLCSVGLSRPAYTLAVTYSTFANSDLSNEVYGGSVLLAALAKTDDHTVRRARQELRLAKVLVEGSRQDHYRLDFAPGPLAPEDRPRHGRNARRATEIGNDAPRESAPRDDAPRGNAPLRGNAPRGKVDTPPGGTPPVEARSEAREDPDQGVLANTLPSPPSSAPGASVESPTVTTIRPSPHPTTQGGGSAVAAQQQATLPGVTAVPPPAKEAKKPKAPRPPSPTAEATKAAAKAWHETHVEVCGRPPDWTGPDHRAAKEIGKLAIPDAELRRLMAWWLRSPDNLGTRDPSLAMFARKVAAVRKACPAPIGSPSVTGGIPTVLGYGCEATPSLWADAEDAMRRISAEHGKSWSATRDRYGVVFRQNGSGTWALHAGDARWYLGHLKDPEAGAMSVPDFLLVQKGVRAKRVEVAG